jgi:acyl-coenzyme A thioesterase PaaI-like protein
VSASGEEIGGPEFARMIEEFRRLQDWVSVAHPPSGVVVETTERLATISALLAPYAAEEDQRIAGKRWDLDGRGQTFVPPISIDYSDSQRRAGRVAFSPFHLGSGGVVNGGVIPLVFTEMLGLFAKSAGRLSGRMAYLNVDFKAPIYVGAEVGIEAVLLKVEGRKIVVGGRLTDDGVDLANAEALFVVPRA